MHISEYFEHVWRPSIGKYKYSGWKLSKLGHNKRILDVGCGYNEFKQFYKNNLLGIDPYNNAADIRVSIEEFETDELFDIAFCLGSINFGDENTILKQIEKVVSLVKPGGAIYWRQNPGLKDHNNEECKSIDFFDWSFEKNLDYAKRFGCHVHLLVWDTDNRIYSEWTR